MQASLSRDGGAVLAIVPTVIVEPWGQMRVDISPDEAAFVCDARALPRSHPTARVFLPGWSKAADDFDPTHVHVEEEPYSLLAVQSALYARSRGVPFSFFSWENLERDLSPVQRLVEYVVCSIAQTAIAGNEGARARLSMRLMSSQVRVAPQMGVAAGGISPRLHRPDKIRAIYLGRLVPEKGLRDLVEALDRVPNIVLTVGGVGPLGGWLNGLAHPRIRLLGRVERGQIQQVLTSQDVLILPSVSTPDWVEQFGHVLIEAMAAGVVPVGSSSGAIPEVIGNDSLIFREGDSRDLAKVLTGLANDPARLEALSRHFLRRATSEFSDQSVADRTLAAIVAPQHSTLTVALVADSPQEEWPSMEIYADEVHRHLSKVNNRVVRASGPPSGSATYRRIRRAFDRYLFIPWLLRGTAKCDPSMIIHVLDHSYSHLVARLRHHRYVVTCHDLIGLTHKRRSAGARLYRRAVKRIGRADAVVAISQATANVIGQELGVDPGRVNIGPHGVREELFSTAWRGRGDPTIRVLHVGTNAANKRVDLAARAAAATANRGSKVEFWKVGPALGPQELATLRESKVPVIHWQNVSTSQLAEIYATASVLLLPSSVEGQNIPLLEALAVGLPVVASAAVALLEMGGGYSLHAASDSPDEYADLILRARESRSAVLDGGRRWARQYRWSAHAETLERVYRGLR